MHIRLQNFLCKPEDILCFNCWSSNKSKATESKQLSTSVVSNFKYILPGDTKYIRTKKYGILTGTISKIKYLNSEPLYILSCKMGQNNIEISNLESQDLYSTIESAKISRSLILDMNDSVIYYDEDYDGDFI